MEVLDYGAELLGPTGKISLTRSNRLELSISLKKKKKLRVSG